jgi:competence protein ComEC
MSGEMRNAFNVTGLAHILSISGAHFGLLLFILFKFFRLLIKLLPHNVLARMSLYASPSQVAAALTFPVITAYLGISTMEFPAVRSYIMISLFLFGLLIHRKGFWMNTLLFAAALIILIQPDALIQLSCQLSFLAVLCLGFYADFERKRKERLTAVELTCPSESAENSHTPRQGMLKRALSASYRYVVASSMISVAATAGTAPLVAYSFNYFSIISPLSNLIVTPLIGFVILPIALLSSFIYLISGIFPLRSFIDAATGLSLEITKYMGSWDFAAVPVPAFPAILLLTFYTGLIGCAVIYKNSGKSKITEKQANAHPDRKLAIVSLSMAILPILFYVFFTAAKERGMGVTFLDVGQGDSAVVELPDGKVIVIDTGKNGFQTAGFLKYRGYRKIDLLVLTHGHPDHSGGFQYLAKNYKIAEIWDNDFISYGNALSAGAVRRNVVRGDVVDRGSYMITVFHPYKGFYTARLGNDAENNQSVVLRIAGRKLSLLFTGDISAEAEDDIVHLGKYLKSVVLKVPHHGSRKSLAQDFLLQARPDIAVISAGRNNMFGHPHPDTLARLSGINIYRTDRDGAVGISEMPDGSIKIRTWEEMRIKEAINPEEEIANLVKLFLLW